MTPLADALRRHIQLDRASFHTPGHKGNPAALPGDLFRMDLTELPDTDSLYEAEGAILQAEQLAARTFSAKRTLFSAGGCTLCIQAMIRLALPCGGRLLCARNAHRAAVHTMALLGVDPVWAMPDEMEDRLRTQPDIQAAYVTSPDYAGRLLDIPALSKACRKRGIPLLVDNAHGAHLAFTEPNLHPLALGASMTACSAHKTLPVLTGGAWLNLGDSVYVEGAKDAMALFGSTSPSFPVLASLDLAREWLDTQGRRAFTALSQRVAQTRALAERLGIPGAGENCDPTRITLRTAAVGLTGTQAAALLRGYGVEPEYADREAVVLIATPFNTQQDFSRLEGALEAFPRTAPLSLPAAEFPPLPPILLSPRAALSAPGEEVPLSHAQGRVAARAACPCPPGIPVVMPGEQITREAAEFLRGYGFFSIKVLK